MTASLDALDVEGSLRALKDVLVIRTSLALCVGNRVIALLSPAVGVVLEVCVGCAPSITFGITALSREH